jgi:hypothetical protein
VVVRDLNGNPIGETVLNGEVWDTPLRADLVHHAVLWQRYYVFRPPTLPRSMDPLPSLRGFGSTLTRVGVQLACLSCTGLPQSLPGSPESCGGCQPDHCPRQAEQSRGRARGERAYTVCSNQDLTYQPRHSTSHV